MDYKFPVGAVVLIKDEVTESDFYSIGLSFDHLSLLRKCRLTALPYIAHWGEDNPYKNKPSYQVTLSGRFTLGRDSHYVLPEAFLELCKTHLYNYQFTLIITEKASNIEQAKEFMAEILEDMINEEFSILPHGELKRV